MNPPNPSSRGQRYLRSRNRSSEARHSEARHIEHEEEKLIAGMESADEYLWARFILRLVAVVAIFVSAALVTHSLITLIGMSRAIPDSLPGVSPVSTNGMHVQLTGMLGQIGMFTIIAEASIALWGLILFQLSSRISKRIAD